MNRKRGADYFLLTFASGHTQGASGQCYKRQQKFSAKNNGGKIACKIASDKVVWFVPFMIHKSEGLDTGWCFLRRGNSALVKIGRCCCGFCWLFRAEEALGIGKA